MRCSSKPDGRPLRPTVERPTVGWRTERPHIGSAPISPSDAQQSLLWRRSHGVVSFAGALDFCTGPLLERYFASHPGPARLDLRAITFLDASGLHALERVRERCRANGWSFTIEHCSAPVARLLRLVGVYEELVGHLIA
jgi:anti-anti-sigma factor